MRRIVLLPVPLAALGLLCAQTAPPKSWIDSDTGHRVIRLTDEPGSASLYFHQNPFTAGGRKMVYTSPSGIHVIDLVTHASKLVVQGRARLILAGRNSQNIFFTRDGAAFSADVDTGAVREIGKLPVRGSIATVNADETLLAGSYIEGDGRDYNQSRSSQQQQGQQQQGQQPSQQQGHNLVQPANKGQMMEERLAARLPMAMFTMDVKTGAVKVIHKATDWLNHFQFSPTDPGLLMFCHEGPWHKVDRIWTIRTDGSKLTKVHTRTMAMEIFGHEFFDPDGKTIWYDLQTPRGEVFWLAGYDLETGRRTWYSLARNEWSIHFNTIPGGKIFCGDGGDQGQVARAKDGKWIYLFRPELVPNRGIDDKSLVQPGVLRAEKLVNMSKHDYRLEPNVMFTLDQKWVIFRSNMFGETYTFAVEVEKAQNSSSLGSGRSGSQGQ